MYLHQSRIIESRLFRKSDFIIVKLTCYLKAKCKALFSLRSATLIVTL